MILGVLLAVISLVYYATIGSDPIWRGNKGIREVILLLLLFSLASIAFGIKTMIWPSNKDKMV